MCWSGLHETFCRMRVVLVKDSLSVAPMFFGKTPAKHAAEPRDTKLAQSFVQAAAAHSGSANWIDSTTRGGGYQRERLEIGRGCECRSHRERSPFVQKKRLHNSTVVAPHE